ncbi:hypothetical protein TNCV_403501, partial [Trichonephila clavipes]
MKIMMENWVASIESLRSIVLGEEINEVHYNTYNIAFFYYYRCPNYPKALIWLLPIRVQLFEPVRSSQGGYHSTRDKPQCHFGSERFAATQDIE